MRFHGIACVLAALFASTAFGQSDRVLHFTHTEGVRNIQEIATLIRAIANMPETTADPAQQTLSLHGTAAQIGLAEWLFAGLDQTAAGTPDKYPMPDGSDDVVALYYVPYAPTVQEFQEVVTAVRSVANIRRLFTYNAPRAVAVRGTADQVSLAGWLFDQMGKPGDGTAPREYRMPVGAFPDGFFNVVRVFNVPNAKTVQDFQELAVLVRSVADIRQLFTYNAHREMAVRGTDGQIALAEWLFNELDKPVNGPPFAREYPMPGSGDVVGLFYLPHIETVAQFQQVAQQVRSATQVRRLLTYNGPRAIALRGTAEQIATAGRIVEQRDK